MESIGIDELKRGTNEAVCYADDCLFVSESLQCLCTSEPVRLDFSLMVFCMEGCVEWEQNGVTFAHADQLLGQDASEGAGGRWVGWVAVPEWRGAPNDENEGGNNG